MTPPRPVLLALFLPLLLHAGAAAAQMYKCKNERGTVQYSDTCR